MDVRQLLATSGGDGSLADQAASGRKSLCGSYGILLGGGEQEPGARHQHSFGEAIEDYAVDIELSLDELVQGECPLSHEPLGRLHQVTRIPIFEAPTDARRFQQLAGKAVGFEAWRQFEYQETIVEWAIDSVAGRVGANAKTKRMEHVFVAKFSDYPIAKDRYLVCMPRSALYFQNLLGADVRSVEMQLDSETLQELCTRLNRVAETGEYSAEFGKPRNYDLSRPSGERQNLTAWMSLGSGDDVQVLQVLTADLQELKNALD